MFGTLMPSAPVFSGVDSWDGSPDAAEKMYSRTKFGCWYPESMRTDGTIGVHSLGQRLFEAEH